MVAAALIVLVYLSRLDALIAFIIIGREITISALREWMAQIGKGQKSGCLIFGQAENRIANGRHPVAVVSRQNRGGLRPTESRNVADLPGRDYLGLWSMAYYLKVAHPPSIETWLNYVHQIYELHRPFLDNGTSILIMPGLYFAGIAQW